MKQLFVLFILMTGVLPVHAQNVMLIKDITSDETPSVSCSDTIAGQLGNKILFVVRRAPSYTWPDLYVSDGTAGGTIMIHDGIEDDRIEQFVKINDNKMAYVMFNNLDQTFKLYTTDGSTKELITAHDNSTIYNLKSVGNDLMYNNAAQIRKVDLSNALEEQVLNVAPRTLMDFYFDGPNVVYYAVKPVNTSQDDTLYVRDLTTSVVKNLGAISKCNSSLVQYNLNFTKLSNRIILFNVGNDDMAYMYSSDGTVSSTVLLKEFSSLSQTLCYIKLVENGKLYFDGISLESNTSAEDFFVSDGTVSGTYSLYSEETKFSNVISAVAFNDKIYFKAYDGIEWSLYTTDGTVAGTVMTPYKSNSLDGITVQNDLLLVTSYTGVYGEQMSNDGMWVFTKEEGLNLTNDYYRLFDQAGSFYTCNLYATPDKIFFIGNTVATSSEPFLFTPNDRVVTSSVAHGSEESVVNLYPNPVTDQMTWEYKGSDAIIKMHLRDINGKSVSAWNNSVTTIDMSSLVQGVYILEVEWENSKQVLKVVKK